MSKTYTNDFQRSQSVGFNVQDMTCWTCEEIDAIQEACMKKNQIVLPVSRVFTFNGTGYRFNALVVDRYFRVDIEEYLFSQRIEFYSQAEGSDSVALLFIKQTPAQDILKNIKYLKKGE